MSQSEEHNEAQRAYYRARRPRTMLPVASAYSTRHFEEAAAFVGLRREDRVLELGSGLGRFSLQFAERGCELTCLELSADLAATCSQALSGHTRATVQVGDALQPSADLAGRFDLVAGFFFLHHVPELAHLLAAARACLVRGGRFVFVEPNPLNPLYYLQIGLSPGMRWENERGLLQMRLGPIVRAARAAGFGAVSTSSYGAVPRLAYDALARVGAERLPERLVPGPLKPFRVFAGTAE